MLGLLIRTNVVARLHAQFHNSLIGITTNKGEFGQTEKSPLFHILQNPHVRLCSSVRVRGTRFSIIILRSTPVRSFQRGVVLSLENSDAWCTECGDNNLPLRLCINVIHHIEANSKHSITAGSVCLPDKSVLCDSEHCTDVR